MLRFSTYLLLSLLLLSPAAQQPTATAAPPKEPHTEPRPSGSAPSQAPEEEKPEEKQPEEKETEEKEAEEKETEEEETEEKETEEKETKKKEPKESPKPHQVERKPLKIEAKIDGVFVASALQQVALRPEVWSQFKVVEAVQHGAQVKKGDVLVRFDDEKIEKELADEMLKQQLGELAMMRAEEEFPREKKRLKLSYEEARREHAELLEDYEYYKNTDRPFLVKIANYRYQEAKESLASQREELEQLEKMYEADELTEETEAIVLRRQRFEVETAELILKLQTAGRDFTLNVQLPRSDQSYATRIEKANLALEQVRTAKEIGLTRGRYELEKKRAARARSVERHSKLVSDRALMLLRAPSDGTVYYGKCVAGKWSEVASYMSKLKPFGTVTANKVLMTIVQQRPLYVQAALAEKELPDFEGGLPATLIPAGDTDLELPGKVTKILGIPGGDKKFAMQLEVDTVNAPEWLVAGMTCKANVTVYEKESAFVIPTKLVETDKDDEKIKYVMLVDPEQDQPVRRNVILGRKKEKLVEVLKGLDEGDKIVKKKKDK